MESKKNWKKWFYWFSFAVATIVVFKTVDSIGHCITWLGNFINLLMPFIMAVIIAYLLYIPARKIEKSFKKSKVKLVAKGARKLSVLTIYIIAIIIIIILVNFIIPAVYSSIFDLVNQIPSYYSKAKEFIENQPENIIINKINIENILNEISHIDFTKFISPENINNYIKSAMGVANFIFNMFVTLIVSVYLLLERSQIKMFFKKLFSATFKAETYDVLDNYFAKSNKIFFNFISGQVFDAFVVGIITSIAMSIMNVKYAILLGTVIGLFNVIPYFGAIIGVGLAVLITIFTAGIPKAIVLLIVLVILQQIDANIINPKILGNSLTISPILIIFAVTVGGAYFGVLGMFLAVPVVTLIKQILLDFIEYKQMIKSMSE